MKIFKRAASLAIALMVVMNLATISAFADGISLTEDFEHISLTDGYFINFPNASQGQTSDVFVDDGRGQAGYKIVSETGADGNTSNMLELRNSTGDYVYLKTKPMSWWAPGSVTNYSFDINFKSIPDGITKAAADVRLIDVMESFNVRDGALSTIYAKDSDTSDTAAIMQNKWYKFKMTVAPNGNRTDYLIDAETGEVVLSQLIRTYESQISSASSLAAVRLWRVTAESPRASILIDNVSFASYNPSTTPASLVKSSVANGETDYPRNKAMTFKFSQPVLGEVVLKKGDETVATSLPTGTSGEEMTISFDSSILERKTTYTLTFGGVLNSENLPCVDSDITFTTEDMHLYDEVVISGVTQNEANTDITFTISDMYDYPVFTGSAVASLYRNGQMIGLAMVTLSAQNVVAPITKTFSLGAIPQTGDTVKIVLVDNITKFVPIAVGSFIK